MEDIYMLSDTVITSRLGSRLKSLRLRQNITQQSLSEAAGVMLSSIKKMEKGEIRSFESLLRVLRILGKLEVFLPLVEEEELSPSEYYELVQASGKHLRKRAAGQIRQTNKEDTEW